LGAWRNGRSKIRRIPEREGSPGFREFIYAGHLSRPDYLNWRLGFGGGWRERFEAGADFGFVVVCHAEAGAGDSGGSFDEVEVLLVVVEEFGRFRFRELTVPLRFSRDSI
jgi:hypothetical protein